MRNRKYIAVLLALTLMFSTIPGAVLSADDSSLGKEAAACKELGILIGADASGVTASYLATTPTRIQAFIIFLRLKGLYSEATAFEGSNNFGDAAATGWAKNYMAYAKSKPELGWVGDGTNFKPNDAITAQQYYKVMLETLGYKQGIDFTYAETLKFAEKISLIKSADETGKLKSFTINDVAKGIYSTLNTKPLNSAKKLISVMVDSKIITAEKAVAAGFTLDTENAKVQHFEAITNNKLELEFDKPIALQKGDIEINQVGTNSRLSILSVNSQKNKATIVTTEAKPFNAYEITINTLVPTENMVVRDYKIKYVGQPKDIVKPTAKHEMISSKEIMVTFSEEVDSASAENVSNYTIEHNVFISNVELLEDGKSVMINTDGISPNSFYRLNVQNVADISGNPMERYTALFEGMKSDSQGPSVTSVNSESNSTVVVTFNKRVDSATAEDTSNYSLDNGIYVNDAKLDSSGKSVRLSTSLQQSGIIYKLTTQNVMDTYGNVMNKKVWQFVQGTSKYTAVVASVSNNEVIVTFNDKVDKATAESADNYMIDKNLEVKRAILDNSGKVVTLITSNQTAHELYTINIMGVFDSWGNVISISSGKFGGAPANTKELSYTVRGAAGNIILTFNKGVDKESAEDVFNYTLDSELGYAAKATLDDSGRIVTLLTASQSSGKQYSITVNNVKDLAGNQLSTDERICTKKFNGIGGSSGSSDTLALETIVTVNVNTFDLMFNDEISEDELDDIKVSADVPDDVSYSLPDSMSYVKYYVGNHKNVRIQFKTDSSNNPQLFKSGNIYEAKVSGIDRLYTKNSANIKAFAGTSIENEAPKVMQVTALNSTAVEVVFTEPVKGITRSQFEIKNSITISSVSVSESDITERVTLFLSSGSKLNDGMDYRLYVKSGVKDAAGLNSVNSSSSSGSYTEFDGNSSDNEAPYIDSDINVVDQYTLQFVFNEPVKNIGSNSFSIKKTSGSGSSNFVISKAVLSDDKMTVTLYYNYKNAGFVGDNIYEMTISTSVGDLQGLSIASDNRKHEFGGVADSPEDLEIISSQIDEDNKVITLTANKLLVVSSLSISDFDLTGAGYNESSSDKVEYDDKTIVITLKNELDSGEELSIEITSTGRSKIKDYNGQTLETEEVELTTR